MRNKPQRINGLQILAAAVLIFALTVIGPVYGHTVGISRGEYTVAGRDVTAELVFARPELAGSVPGLDSNRDGTVSQDEMIAGRTAIEEFFVHGLNVVGSASCTGKIGNGTLTEEDGVSIRISFHCPAATDSVQMDLKFLAGFSEGHRHLATAINGSSNTHVMAYAGNSQFQIGATHATWIDAVWPLFLLGIRHILTGYDHLLFLFGLILVGGRTRSLMLAITAFTIAHSITLGVSALQIWAPSTRFVEPAIALSIAYIGVENWFVKDASRRWLITFPFGLIHGFGFAGALRQIALPHSEVPVALLSFNLGVEVGQLAVIAVVLPAIFWLRRRQWFVDQGVQAISGAIVLAGVCWFLIRIQ